MNKTQLFNLETGERVKDKINGEIGTVTGYHRHHDNSWHVSEIWTNNDKVSSFPRDLIVLRKKEPEIVGIEWFARGGGLACMGPFKSQLKAWEAVMSADDPTKPIAGATVWCARKKNSVKKV